MKIKNFIISIAFAFTLFLILTSPNVSATFVQNASSVSQYAYISNPGNNTVSVIDTAIHTKIATVPVGSNPNFYGQFSGYPEQSSILPVANFSTDITYSYSPLTVQFTDLSENATKWYWDFGDGEYSNEQNPVHTYSSTRNYMAKLTVTNEKGTNTTIGAIKVQADSPVYYPENGHYYEVITTPYGITWEGAKNASHALSYSGMNGHLATITSQDENDFIVNNFDLSEHWAGGFQPDDSMEPEGGWQWVTGEPWVYANWDYGEPNNVNGGEEFLHFNGNEYWNDISHNNLQTGYIVEYEATPATNNVTATEGIGSDPVAVTPDGTKVLPFANFTYVIDPSSATVQFIDLSENATEWYWEFGDGLHSTERNPTHAYRIEGDYVIYFPSGESCIYVSDDELSRALCIFNYVPLENLRVTLTAMNGNGADYISKQTNISSSPEPETLSAHFLSFPVENNPLSIQFIDNSMPSPGIYNWDFGDGTTSTEQNPIHTYPSAGNYTVTLLLSGGWAGGTSEVISVQDSNASVANFSASPVCGKAPLKVRFTDKSTGSPAEWKWCFGDGTSSKEKNPVHTYCKAGEYNVTLITNSTPGSNKVTKSEYIRVLK